MTTIVTVSATLSNTRNASHRRNAICGVPSSRRSFTLGSNSGTAS